MILLLLNLTTLLNDNRQNKNHTLIPSPELR